MRLVSWNVCDAFQRKFGHLERLQPHVAVLQEVRPECLSFAALQNRSAWIGDHGQKGLAIVAYGDWRLQPADVRTDERWFLPLQATNGRESVNIVAVWVDSSRDCTPPTLRALDHLRSFIEARPCIIAGDFNQTVAMDRRRGPGRRFADVLTLLGDMGLVSAWHAYRNEAQGGETAATLHWTWNRERPFHIDFAFGSADLRIKAVHLGGFDQYVATRISDHVPLTVDYVVGEAATGHP